ncbi:MAG: hypothetical protein HZA36_01920 [Parcubacteria group bacterium]|nr:hypothetical protein [Parcubacteria group bacterium]
MRKFATLLLVMSFFWCISKAGSAAPNDDSLPKVERKGNVVTISYVDPRALEQELGKYAGHVQAAYTFRMSPYGAQSKLVLITDLKEGQEPYREGRLCVVDVDPTDKGYEAIANELANDQVRAAVVTTPLTGTRLLLYLFLK